MRFIHVNVGSHCRCLGGGVPTAPHLGTGDYRGKK